MTAQFLTGAAVLQGRRWVHGHGVLLAHGRIAAVLPDTRAPDAPRVALPQGSLLAPGLIDIQVNGGGGYQFNDAPTPAAARAIAAAHRLLGTTAILPTLITDTRQMLQAAAEAAVCGDGVLGIHFEGPFLSPARPGVHPASLIRPPEAADIALLRALAARLDGPVMVTLAPEMVTDDVLAELAGAGILLSAGHSEASWERVAAARHAGLRGFTHLFNAMPPLSARAPGIAAAALLAAGQGGDGQSWVGVIADMIHVHPAMLRLLLATRPPERIVLVSDAMAPTGSDIAAFGLQGRTIYRRDGRLVTAEGTLAGADLCLAEAVRRVVRQLGVPVADALIMATQAPAEFLRVDHRLGRIAPGYQADLVLLSAALDVLGTWVCGEWLRA